MRKTTFPRLLFLLSGLFLLTASAAPAQVLVYKLWFETTGKTLNYDFYEAGYFVCEAPRGDGTFILTGRASDNTSRYNTEGSGTLFYVQDGREYLAVLKAGGGTDGADATYQATGNVDGSRSIGGDIKMPFARDLDGYLVASQESGDALVNDNRERTDGFAGYSKMKVRIDTGRTGDANEDMLTIDETVDSIVDYLEARGFKAETAVTPQQ